MQAHLVYQSGMANVCSGDAVTNVLRLYQGDYRGAENFAAGMVAAGATLSVWHCDTCGDIVSLVENWQEGPGELWAEKKRPVH